MSQIDVARTASGGISRDDPRLALIAERLKREFGAERVILFGSVARGTATKDSDVDLLVVAPSDEPYRDHANRLHELLRDVGRGMHLSPILRTPNELRQRLELGDQFFQEILNTGIELCGTGAQLMGTGNPPSPAYIEEWREHARQDWRAMRILLDAGHAASAGQFLEQSVEKFLKAFLLARGWKLERTHDLTDLLPLAIAHDSRLAAYVALCQSATDFYLADRYPGSKRKAPPLQDVSQAAREAVQFISTLFPDETLQAP
jgi:uncharacterized protein